MTDETSLFRKTVRRLMQMELAPHNANGALKKLRIHLGRVIRDIARKIEGRTDLLGEIVLGACWRWRDGCSTRSSTRADRRSIRCMRPRSNASARARRTG